MKAKQFAMVVLGLLLSFCFCGNLLATTLTGKVRVDDEFKLYLSTSDTEQGTLIASGSQWNATFSISASLINGQEYYLHLFAKDNGGAAGFLAEFSVDSNYHRFSNNRSRIVTNTVNWRVSKTGWGNYVNAADAGGINGNGTAQIGSDANWIWSADAQNDDQVYFSLKINSQATPYASELRGKIRVDDQSRVYLSTDDNVQGSLLGASSDWQSTYFVNATLTEGQTYFLHVYGKNLQDVAAILGEFSLTGTEHVFSNNQSSIVTNTADWKVSRTGWNNYVNASIVNGKNGVNPWGNNPQISADAYWIWTDKPYNDSEVYFSVAISANQVSQVSGQCAAVFPNGASSHSGNGYIDFGYNAQVLGASSNVLATSTITHKGGSTILSCETQNCSASGDSSEAIAIGRFIRKASTTDVSLGYQGAVTLGSGGYPGDTYRVVNSGQASEATITFSNNHSEYFIDSLKLAFKNTLYLQAGSTYWINQLSMSSQARIIVQGSGTAITYVNQSIAFPSPGYINSPAANTSGDASKLVLYAFNNVSFNNQSTFSGSLYAQGDIILGSASYAFGAVSGDNIRLDTNSTITYQGSSIANTTYGDICGAVTDTVDHFRIEHDSQGFTCEAETVTIKACADANCGQLFDKPTSISMTPGNWLGGNTISFTGAVSKNVNITTAGNYTFARTASTDNAPLRCFSGAKETCAISFVDAGFEFIGASVNDKLLADQLAEQPFNQINLRAVYNDNGVCAAALVGQHPVNLSFDCVAPDTCQTPLSGFSLSNAQGSNSGQVNLSFNAEGIAVLDNLSFADAGTLQLAASAQIDGANLLQGQASIDVYPASLAINVSPASILANGAADAGTIVAGSTFSVSIGAYGASGHLLPNYQPEKLQLKVSRLYPTAGGSANGLFNYADNSQVLSGVSVQFQNIANVGFSKGEYVYPGAYYTESGRISLDVRDASYRGNLISSVGEISLDRFIPAYFVAATDGAGPGLTDVQSGFSYVGQTIRFASPLQLNLRAYNALNQALVNYDSNDWLLRPTLADLNDDTQVIFSDTSTYTGSTTVYKGDAVLVSGDDNFDGTATLTVSDTTIRYNKTAANYSMFAPAAPFAASLTVELSADFLTDSDGVCVRDNAADTSCNGFSFNDISGANLRYGRFAFDSTYGPENEPLRPNFRAEYFDGSRWLVNTLDNSTPINFSEINKQLILSAKGSSDITGLIDPISSDGTLLLGVADSSADFDLSAPGQMGEVILQLNPQLNPNDWPSYLNYDWNGDGMICNQDGLCSGGLGIDFPQAILSFGLFRGNDRVIQWREVFN